ncbi:NUDIX hydrolase [Microvirga puerhi]|uniref:NUDIX hydrolase n=1 Tax=Microvirga puerhi TaxID=2876078 RepID=A0ABS7VKV8_9HYPH|nr:NUDIX hydrolase [Microvirga puerhi]MBZ6076175.1 NUDIX hydrolase [Microvirga puerhi]
MSGQVTRFPIPAVIAVVIRDQQALLVRRANPPDAGLWGFPGGKIGYGETVSAAALRELREETAIEATAAEILTSLDIFDHDPDGTLRHHYVLIAVRCTYMSGEPSAGDDALEARWLPIADLDPEILPMSADVAKIAHLALDRLDRT